MLMPLSEAPLSFAIEAVVFERHVLTFGRGWIKSISYHPDMVLGIKSISFGPYSKTNTTPVYWQNKTKRTEFRNPRWKRVWSAAEKWECTKSIGKWVTDSFRLVSYLPSHFSMSCRCTAQSWLYLYFICSCKSVAASTVHITVLSEMVILHQPDVKGTSVSWNGQGQRLSSKREGTETRCMSHVNDRT